jgi:hypothetical protein
MADDAMQRDEDARPGRGCPPELGALCERRVDRARANGSFAVDNLVIADGATLALHGEVSANATPHLEAVLEGVISLDPCALTIDLTRTTMVSLEALAALARAAGRVDRLDLRLPKGLRQALDGLVHAGGALI